MVLFFTRELCHKDSQLLGSRCWRVNLTKFLSDSGNTIKHVFSTYTAVYGVYKITKGLDFSFFIRNDLQCKALANISKAKQRNFTSPGFVFPKLKYDMFIVIVQLLFSIRFKEAIYA